MTQTKKAKSWEYNGKAYKTLWELAKAEQKEYPVISARLSCGWTLDEAMQRTVRKQGTTDHLGQKFRTSKDMLQHYNLTAGLYYYRRYTLGWSLEKTLTTPVRRYTAKHERNI